LLHLPVPSLPLSPDSQQSDLDVEPALLVLPDGQAVQPDEPFDGEP